MMNQHIVRKSRVLAALFMLLAFAGPQSPAAGVNNPGYPVDNSTAVALINNLEAVLKASRKACDTAQQALTPGGGNRQYDALQAAVTGLKKATIGQLTFQGAQLYLPSTRAYGPACV